MEISLILWIKLDGFTTGSGTVEVSNALYIEFTNGGAKGRVTQTHHEVLSLGKLALSASPCCDETRGCRRQREQKPKYALTLIAEWQGINGLSNFVLAVTDLTPLPVF